MMNRYSTFVVCFSLLAGCAHAPAGSPDDAETERLDAAARAALADYQPPFPANLVRTPEGKTRLPQGPMIRQSVARPLWQEDRNRLDACVATHQAIVSELTVREILEQSNESL